MREQLAQRFVEHVERRVLAAGEFDAMLDRIAAREVDPYTIADEIFGRAVHAAGAGTKTGKTGRTGQS